MKTPQVLALLALGTFLCNLPIALGLISPVFTRSNEIQAALFYDPGLTVSQEQPNDAELSITVNVKACPTCRGKAKALATLLPLYGNAELGGTNLTTTVTYGGGQGVVEAGDLPTTGAQASAMLRRALNGNKMFVRTAMGGFYRFVLFNPRVVQVYTDDLMSWKGMTTHIAADLLSDVYGITGLDGKLEGDTVVGSTRFCNSEKGCI